jgi:hypothetical protein
MLGTEPNGIHLIPQMDALKLKLTTELAAADELVLAHDCKDKQSIADCAAPVSPPPPVAVAPTMAGK